MLRGLAGSVSLSLDLAHYGDAELPRVPLPAGDHQSCRVVVPQVQPRFRDVEDLLAERGVIVTYESIRQWCATFGLEYARRLRRRPGRQGDTWYLDEVFVRIQGRQQYLWRAVDEDGDGLDILVQPRRNRRAAIRFFRKLVKRQGATPRRLVTDKTAQLRRCLPNGDVVGRPPLGAVRQQPSRSLPRIDAPAGTAHARLQVGGAASAVRLSTESYRIFSGSGGISSERTTIAFYGGVPSTNGRR